jgi:peptide/nickel transport system permease protein
LRFLCAGEAYRFLGLIPAHTRLVCAPEGGALHLLGTDRLGRDVFSRLLYGARISLTIGLIGVVISMSLGVLFGLAAGYLGGWIDAAILRLIEFLRSLPELPLWMALAAALPVTWSPLWVYAGITVILGLLDWPGLARAVRAKVLTLREEEFTVAAKLMGASPWRIMTRHLVPNFSSHLIASAALAVPGMILGETALSFLGLGLRPPITSWGVMLSEAQNLAVIEVYPWLLAPLVPVVLVILAFNVLGDGLRDAADPYAR